MTRPLPRLVAWLLRVTVPDQWADTVRDDVEADWQARLARGDRSALARTLADTVQIAARFAAEGVRLAASGTARDGREAVRALTRRPRFAVAAVATLGLGFGVNIAAFAVVDRVLLQPLPYAEPQALVELRARAVDAPAADARPVVSSVDVDVWHDGLSDLVDIAAYQTETVRVRGAGSDLPVSMTAAHVTPNLFDVIGVSPSVGRAFRPDEGRRGGEGVAVVASHVWQTRFGGRPDLLGRVLEIDGRPHTVVGVAPPGLEFPPGVGVWLARHTSGEAFRGLQIEFASLRVVGRLRGAAGAVRLAELADRGAAAARDAGRPVAPLPVPLHDAVVGGVRPALQLGWLAVGLLLLIACANAAGLLSIRAAARQRELALRLSLGASRAAVTRLVAVEACVLVAAGLVAGVALAIVALRLFGIAEPGVVPRLAGVAVSWADVAYGAGLALGAGVLLGVAPLLDSTWARGGGVAGRPGAAGSDRGARGGEATFVALQLAVSVVLLVAATLTTWGVARQVLRDPGFEARGVITLAIRPNPSHVDAPQHGGVYAPLVERVAAIDGVTAVAMTDHLPPEAAGLEAAVVIEGQPAADPAAQVRTLGVTPGYFDVMGIPLWHGRSFTEAEIAAGAPVAIVDTLVARRAGTTDIVGRRLVMHGRVLEVVGVVAPARQGRLDAPPGPTVYRPMPTGAYGAGPMTFLTTTYLIARTDGDPARLASAVRSAATAPPVVVETLDLATLDDRLWASLARPRFHAAVFGSFALVGALLAALGVYALVSFVVLRLTPEIGVRLALGAPRGRLVREVFGRSLAPAGLGVAAGLAVAPATAAAIAHRIDGVADAGAGLYASVGAMLLAVVVVACLPPAWRATRIDPVASLRRGE
ncbi:MAG: ABC transporter permease [Vicinamibacterales bacterium]